MANQHIISVNGNPFTTTDFTVSTRYSIIANGSSIKLNKALDYSTYRDIFNWLNVEHLSISIDVNNMNNTRNNAKEVYNDAIQHCRDAGAQIIEMGSQQVLIFGLALNNGYPEWCGCFLFCDKASTSGTTRLINVQMYSSRNFDRISDTFIRLANSGGLNLQICSHMNNGGGNIPGIQLLVRSETLSTGEVDGISGSSWQITDNPFDSNYPSLYFTNIVNQNYIDEWYSNWRAFDYQSWRSDRCVYIGGGEELAYSGFRNSWDFFYTYQCVNNKGEYGIYGDGAGGYLSTEGGGNGKIKELGLEANRSDEIKKRVNLVNARVGGLYQILNISQRQLESLGKAMWSKDLWDSLVNSVIKPMDYIVNLSAFPIYASGWTNFDTQALFFGNYQLKVDDSPIYGYKLRSEYTSIDCGSVEIPLFWDSCLDLTGTKCTIFLPYIGDINLDINRILDGALSITYYIDAYTGTCTAEVYFNSNQELIRPSGVIGVYSGNCSMPIPITGADYTRNLMGYVQLAKGTMDLLASGIRGDAKKGLTGIENQVKGAYNAVSNTVVNQINTNASASYLGYFQPQKPYITFTRFNQCLPELYGTQSGYPSEITTNLSECTGMTVIDKIILDDIPCSEKERTLIMEHLTSGIII